ncbi:MAG: septum formation inhibitor Maf [Chloroflexi bacterium]|nr:septum formation inhibitor Maf [Chloroflexota bacterium]
MKRIILASASPRRKELLENLGLAFEVEPSESEEIPDAALEPHEVVKRLSLEKAEAVARKQRNAIIIAADTIGFLDGMILGKPSNEDEARRMLRLLSGRTHLVITGFTILDADRGKRLSRIVETKVYIKPLDSEEINAYVQSGEPMDKAGAYAIQGLGSIIVERIEGDYYNVVGLPLSALADGLKEFGVDIWREQLNRR